MLCGVGVRFAALGFDGGSACRRCGSVGWRRECGWERRYRQATMAIEPQTTDEEKGQNCVDYAKTTEVRCV